MRVACTVAARKSVLSARNPRRANCWATGPRAKAKANSFAAIGAARRGHSRGLQRSSLCLIVLTRALCASLVPGGAKSASALATFFANGCDAEASRSHVKTNAPRRRKFSRARRAPPARREGVGGHAPRLASASNARLAPVSGVDDERASERGPTRAKLATDARGRRPPSDFRPPAATRPCRRAS